MFLRQIDEFQTFFKWLDRLNILAYNVWHDTQADAYKTGLMFQIETLYRTYISDMRQISNELALLEKQIAEESREIENLYREIGDIKRDGTINHCYSAVASGYYDAKCKEPGEEWFAMRGGEDAFDVAFERCNDLVVIKEAHLSNSL